MAKAGRALGFLTSLGTLSLYIVLVEFNPYSPGYMTLPIAVMMLLALIGMAASLKASP